MTTSIRASADGLSSIIAVNGVDRFSIDQNGKATATKFAGDGSELTGILKSGTAINTTSGTAHDFTGIPSWVKKITLTVNEVSTSGAGNIRTQLGTSGGIISTGYTGVVSVVTNASGAGAALFSSGFDSFGDGIASAVRGGTLTFSKLSGNIWTLFGGLSQHTGSLIFTMTMVGTVDLGATLTTLRFTNTAGDTFDNGSINILYE